MTETNERTALAESSEAAGWSRRIDESVDVYLRGPSRVRVIWSGDALAGGSRFQDGIMEAYSREMSAVKGWLR